MNNQTQVPTFHENGINPAVHAIAMTDKTNEALHSLIPDFPLHWEMPRYHRDSQILAEQLGRLEEENPETTGLQKSSDAKSINSHGE
jgi:hypothetical protein